MVVLLRLAAELLARRRPRPAVVYPQLLVFEPRRPSPHKQTVRITPDQVASVGAARYSYGGNLEVLLRDGNRRRFSLYVGPAPLNEALRQAGFPVS